MLTDELVNQLPKDVVGENLDTYVTGISHPMPHRPYDIGLLGTLEELLRDESDDESELDYEEPVLTRQETEGVAQSATVISTGSQRTSAGSPPADSMRPVSIPRPILKKRASPRKRTSQKKPLPPKKRLRRSTNSGSSNLSTPPLAPTPLPLVQPAGRPVSINKLRMREYLDSLPGNKKAKSR